MSCCCGRSGNTRDCPWVRALRRTVAEGADADGKTAPSSLASGNAAGRRHQPLLANLFLHYAFDRVDGADASRPFRLSGTRTTRSATAGRVTRPKRCGRRLTSGLRPAGWCSIRRRRRSSTARTPTGAGPIRRERSTSSATRSGRDWRNGAAGSTVSRSCRRRPTGAARRSGETIRRWGLQNRTDKALDDLARMFSPYIRGWINYYGHFYKSALLSSLRRIDVHLVRWAQRKFKSLRHRPKRARDWLARVIRTSPGLFRALEASVCEGRTLGAV